MDSTILFLFKSILISGLLTTWYVIALRNKRLHHYNRFFLLFALFASLVVPLLHFNWFTIHQSNAAVSTPAKYLLQVVNGSAEQEQQVAIKTSAPAVNWSLVVECFVITISIALLVVLLVRILWVFRLAGSKKVPKVDGIKLILTDHPKAPFSFLNYLFWNNSIPLDSEIGQLIYRHELAHIRQKHTCDKLACQVITCVFWMNPFYWFIQKELALIHEFLADGATIKDSNTDAFARMLLQAHSNGSYLVPEHQFFSSPIKRRLTMLQPISKQKHNILRRIAVLPILAGVVLLFSFTANPIKLGAIRSEKKIVLMLDAGHGGNDQGAHFGNLKEKDLALKVVKRINELAPEYNIDVHLTRNTDDYPSLKERVDLSKKMHPDYFISIHINSRAYDSKDFTDPAIELFVYTHNSNPKEIKDKANFLAKSIFNQTGFLRNNAPDSVWISEQPIMVLRENEAPAVLIELGFIQNAEQMQRLSDHTKLDEICAAILKGVVNATKG